MIVHSPSVCILNFEKKADPDQATSQSKYKVRFVNHENTLLSEKLDHTIQSIAREVTEKYLWIELKNSHHYLDRLDQMIYQVEQKPLLSTLAIEDSEYPGLLVIKREAIMHVLEANYQRLPSCSKGITQMLVVFRILGYEIYSWDSATDKLVIDKHLERKLVSEEPLKSYFNVLLYVDNNRKRLYPLRSAVFQVFKSFFGKSSFTESIHYLSFLIRFDFILPKYERKIISELRRADFKFYR